MPESIALQTKPAIATEMIAVALDTGAPCAPWTVDAGFERWLGDAVQEGMIAANMIEDGEIDAN